MKHTVTDLNHPNKLVMFSNSILGNFCIDTFFGELEVDLSPFVDSDMLAPEIFRRSSMLRVIARVKRR